MSNPKILYVDSNENYAHNLLYNLLEKHFETKYLKNINDALIEYSFFNPDIIITDVYFNGDYALDFIKKIRKQNPNIAIVILTESKDQNLLLDAIHLKVEHFIFKHESLEKIISILQNIKISQNNVNNESINYEMYDLGENYLFNGTNIIAPNENLIKLTPQESHLLRILVEQKGNCVSYETLKNSLSEKSATSLDTIRTVIRKIRKKSFNEVIQNQSGLGYKINYNFNILSPQKTLSEIQKVNTDVLIIKGNIKKNDLLSYRLSKYGMNCESAYTLQQAKSLIETTKYQYIIIDLNLPDGESVDFIREFDELYTTKVIVLSNSQDIHYKDYLYFKGILDYIIENKDIEIVSNYIYKTILKVEKNKKYNNILIIEQSKKVCEQIKDLLLPREYNIDIVNELNHAMDIMKSKTYSLVIIDVNFDNCFNFIQNCKTYINKSLNFIVLTEENRSYSLVREAYINGASECLRKPLFAEEFILKVDQLTDTSKLIYELQENKKLLNNYKTIVDQSAIISKTNSKGIITYVNKIFCDISGYTEEELIGKPHNIIRHPDTPKDVFTTMWETIKEKKQIWTGVIKNRAKDGHPYYVQTSIMPILNEKGEIEEFIALRNDITSIYPNK